ncbi:hypothetical protein F0562_017532 [Nyssa sinensis]|uniref:Uncharacterized protein n=1 Tax=Nyssa sinensis TaxID=561372 RepID=A0A5J4ZHU1_9ASTE|nr:hypothetical protein F0562_017532 [Nyssa sinensis]
MAGKPDRFGFRGGDLGSFDGLKQREPLEQQQSQADLWVDGYGKRRKKFAAGVAVVRPEVAARELEQQLLKQQ